MELQSGWDDLPLELLSKVAGGRDALKAMTLVSKTWRVGFEDSVNTIRREIMPIRLQGLPPLPKSNRVHTVVLTGDLSKIGIWALRDSGVKALDLTGCTGVDGELLDTLAGALLESLALRGGEKTVAGLGALRDLPSLNSIMLALDFDDDDSEDFDSEHCKFPNLSSLTSLAKLHLSVESLDYSVGNRFDSVVEAVQGLPMRDLKLTGVSECDVLSSFVGFKEMPLTNLEVRFCHFIIDEDLENLRGLPLTTLALWGDDDEDFECSLSDSGLDVLRGMPLTSLKMSVFFAKPDCFEALRGLPLANLSMSFVSDVEVSDAMAEIFLSLPLTELELDKCVLTDNARARLHALPLKSLRITD